MKVKRGDVGCGSPHAQLDRHPPLRFTYGSHPRSTDRCANRVASAVAAVASAPTPTDSLSLSRIFVDPLDRVGQVGMIGAEIFRYLLDSISTLWNPLEWM